MKDYDVLNEVWEQEVLEDFDGFIAAEDWSQCAAIIQMLGDRGFENTAIRMNHVLNQAKSLGYLEPHEDVIPVMTEQEHQLWSEPHRMDKSEMAWTRESDEKFPPHEEDLLGRIN